MFAVIGGSQAHRLLGSATRLGPAATPYGPSQPLYRLGDVLFLPRHGERGYDVAASFVNYRANIYALREAGATRLLAWSGPGSLEPDWRPGEFVLPDDLIDETRRRESTFFAGTGLGFVRQNPVFCPELRATIAQALAGLGLPVRDGGVYVCTEGPRLETPAEIRKFRSFGANLVGMTLAPEVFLARELEMCYAPLCYITNLAEGMSSRPFRSGELFEGLLDEDGRSAVEAATAKFPEIVSAVSARVTEDRACPCAHLMDRYRREGRIGPDWHTWLGATPR